ncbi:hypothetical protein BC938DRAFT_475130 [Jimgerdemannia flammicorona]|uniref:Uncharacterized protein n=1 Tax=Jimgerdemannia flammicorona TaxID=994334 RepID=A0A433Q057_9FUNG|nr:hypothetical protein BC938DRAFT_475130 [Jimgerdemannia flammicorona]
MHSAFRTPTNAPPSAIRTPALSKSPWRQDLPPKTPIFGDIEMDDKHTATVTTDSGTRRYAANIYSATFCFGPFG